MDQRIAWHRVGDAGLHVVRAEDDAGGVALVDARGAPVRRQAQDDATRWAEVAVAAWREDGREGLRRHHHRRLEELFIRWCQALEAIGEEELVREALAKLRSSRRLDMALEQLEEGHGMEIWQRLARRHRTQPNMLCHELAYRWRLHALLMRAWPCEERDLQISLVISTATTAEVFARLRAPRR